MPKPFKRGKSWYVRKTIGGRRVWKAIGSSKKLAEDYLRNLEAKLALGPLGVPVEDRVTFKDFVKIYERDYGPEKAESSRARDFETLKHLLPVFGKTYLDRIQPTEITAYKTSRLDKVSKSTINREVSLLKSILNRAVEWSYLADSPARNVKPYKVEKTEQKYLTADQVDGLIEAAGDERTRRFIIVATSTGLRKSEIYNLTWEDNIDFKQGFIKGPNQGRGFQVYPLGWPRGPAIRHDE